MKKILLTIMLFIYSLNADTLIVKGPIKKVGERDFTYYCVDGRLYLESKNINRDDTTTFEQVMKRTHVTYIVPAQCTLLVDGTFTYE